MTFLTSKFIKFFLLKISLKIFMHFIDKMAPLFFLKIEARRSESVTYYGIMSVLIYYRNL